MPDVADIRRALSARPPAVADPDDGTRAAVALIARQGPNGAELLFIERAEHDKDPWSGHIGFPGGKVDPSDATARAAAEREVLEELGLDLSLAEYLGRLDDVRGATLPVCVSGHVYTLRDVGPLTLNEEVESAFWVPVSHLADPDRHEMREFRYRGASRAHPAVDLLGRTPVLWGLTYRMVRQLLALLGVDPERP